MFFCMLPVGVVKVIACLVCRLSCLLVYALYYWRTVPSTHHTTVSRSLPISKVDPPPGSCLPPKYTHMYPFLTCPSRYSSPNTRPHSFSPPPSPQRHPSRRTTRAHVPTARHGRGQPGRHRLPVHVRLLLDPPTPPKAGPVFRLRPRGPGLGELALRRGVRGDLYCSCAGHLRRDR